MNQKKNLQKFVLMFGVSAMVLTGIGADTFVAKADILEDTAEDNTEGEDDISTGNNPRDDLRNQLSTKDSTTIVHDGFSYYWYNNNRPNQKTKNGYYQTRYEYLDLPKKQTEIDNIDKKNIDQYTHYENSVFKKYQENPGLLYLDAFGNIVIQSYSTDRNTNNFYRTIGYTFSRIKSSGVLNLDSKKISKRKEVPADKSWLKDDNFNVDDATSKDYAKLYGNPAEPHQLKSGDRETFTVWLPTEVITDEKQKAYFKQRHDKEGTSATYVPPSEYHKSHYESQEDKSVIPLAQAVYRIGIVSGRRRSINTFVYAADDLFGKYSDLKAEQDYPQSKLYRKNREWYNEVREALKYNAAWFGVDAVVEVYSNGRVAKTATWRNPGDANAYADLNNQYSRYFRLGGRIGNSVIIR